MPTIATWRREVFVLFGAVLLRAVRAAVLRFSFPLGELEPLQHFLCYCHVIAHRAMLLFMLSFKRLCYHPCYCPCSGIFIPIISFMLSSICYLPQSYVIFRVIVHVIIHRAMLLSMLSSICYLLHSHVIVHVIDHVVVFSDPCYYSCCSPYVIFQTAMLSSMW